ncbi:hypothetical protein [Sphingomonas nostoxanthinifaciens]|uniref:hypothetical protein n=1 Tax=Sphingomonas nostoxanthinifaciens TaxID=2872652 RepID=UPI001CC1E562|nr:hypothetical protein [Sphingomonas nostoxanthinifaciens]UAK24164.1 hypothetical protein K8P63_17835 [Sphingomonas nostoxanthinifaciens]
MSPEELSDFAEAAAAKNALALGMVDELEAASADVESDDFRSDGFAEAIFLRAFTAYESSVEAMFLHYVTGGASRGGTIGTSYLNVQDAQHARRLTKAGKQYLSWAKPSEIRNTASIYMKEGWPLIDMMATKEEVLSDGERIRNRIAHDSLEARQQFGIVQRNYLGTERLFLMSAGQFLRIRSTRLRKLHLMHFVEVLHETVKALIDPLP